jgi:hypothetical protein
MSVTRTREQAARQVNTLLGISVDVSDLFDLADEVFGTDRADRCRELAGWAPLTRRSMATAAVAELVVAAQRLGSKWWEEERHTMNHDGLWEIEEAPQTLLERGTTSGHSVVGSALEALGRWACDDAADAEWGRPVYFVDLNDSDTNDRVRLPSAVVVGDRLLASYDPGCRVWVDVVERDTADPALEKLGRRQGRIGSVLAEQRCCDAADAGWAWGMATNGRLVRLPGEAPGTDSDPFSRSIPQGAAESLYHRAVELGASVDVLGRSWTTKGQLLEAAYRLGWPYELPGTWHRWGLTAEEIVDRANTVLEAP